MVGLSVDDPEISIWKFRLDGFGVIMTQASGHEEFLVVFLAVEVLH